MLGFIVALPHRFEAQRRNVSARFRCTPRASAKRTGGSGDGGGGGSSGRGFGPKATTPAKKQPSEREDFSPRPPGFSSLPDDETLRAEFDKLGIVPPEGSKIGATRSQTLEDGEDDYVQPSDGTMPEIVASRMGKRMMLFGGVPFILLFVFFGAYFVLTYRFEIRVIPAVVAYSTLALIGSAGVGITYGIMSSSWDPEIEGSRFGWDEAQKNFFRTRDALLGQKQLETQGDEFEKLDQIAAKRAKERENEVDEQEQQ